MRRAFKRARSLLGITAVDHAAIGHQQALGSTQLARHFAQPRKLAGAEQRRACAGENRKASFGVPV